MAIAAIVSAIWLAGAAALLAVLGGEGALWLAVAVAVALPVAVIWFTALVARQSNAFREKDDQQSGKARRKVKADGGAPGRQSSPFAHPTGGRTAPPIRLTQHEALRDTTRHEPPPWEGTEPPEPAVPRDAEALPEQRLLPLDMTAHEASLPLPDLIRALNFPDGPDDRAAFDALHRALAVPSARRLVQASQDILTLLSEEGIYMDDIPPVRARPELWRRFASGERGDAVGRIGGIKDRSSLALTSNRHRSDPVFRDAAHHFLRLFDKTLAEMAPGATDAEVSALADTRTARAFMLIGRIAGTFDQGGGN